MTVFFVGPLPPPVHGFSAINAAMLDLLQGRSKVVVFDRAHRSAPGKRNVLGRAAKLSHWAKLVGRFAIHMATARPKQDAVYLGMSGGAGQLMDAPFVLLARLRGLPIHVHHHSFAYINRASALTRSLLIAMGPRAQHIVLCNAMGEAMRAHYGLPSEAVHTLSNIAFMQPGVPETLSSRPADTPLTLGFLSNITAAKGIFEFFNAVVQCRKQGLNVRALVAGPVADEVRKDFDAALAKSQGLVQHLGPVYGSEKAMFYSRLDLMLFPTKYENEAEPVTILEALQAGVPVVAAQRGCIAGMLAGPWAAQNCQCTPIADFDHAAATAATILTQRSIEASSHAKQSVVRQFNEQRNGAIKQLQRLLDSITRPNQAVE